MTYVINLGDYKSTGTLWVTLYVDSAFELNICQKKLNYLQETKTLQQVFMEQKHIIR